jgi:ankyrin repeat protein
MKFLTSITLVLLLTVDSVGQANSTKTNQTIFTLLKTNNLEKLNASVTITNVNSFDSSGVSLLSRAILDKNFKAVKLLIEKGANPSLRNKTKLKTTPLMMCSNYNLADMASYLIEKGADIDAQDANGDAVINWAAYMGEYTFTKLLLDKGAKTNQKSIHSDNVMGVALKEWKDSIVDLLIDYKKGIHKVEPHRKPLIAAVKKNDFAFVKKHLNQQNCTMRDEAGNTLLIIAATKGYDNIVRLLLLNQADINAINPVGHTALNKAIYFKKNKIAKYLIEHGADVNKTDTRFILTPLIAAARSNNVELGKIILAKGADVNITNGIDTFSPIMWAVVFGNVDFVKLLLNYNPDLTIVSKYGRNIFKMTRNKEILTLLKAHKK